jgi:hypothetical protein
MKAMKQPTRSTSRRLVWHISTIEFFTILCVMENILKKMHCVSFKLQSDNIVLQNAIELIKSIKHKLLNEINQ